MKRFASPALVIRLLICCQAFAVSSLVAQEKQPQWPSRIVRLRPALPYQRSHESVRAAFRSVVEESRKATVEIYCDGKQTAQGVIVDAAGYVLTKASELSGAIRCKLYDNRYYDAEILGIHHDTDLAMLRIAADKLTAIRWSTAPTSEVGSWVVTTGLQSLPKAIGVVSAASRGIPEVKGILGVMLGDSDVEGARVEQVMPESGAEKAGVRPNDVVIGLNDLQIKSRSELIEGVKAYRPGDRVQLKLLRGDKEKVVTAELGSHFELANGHRIDFQGNLGGPLSRRRDGFPAVLQHDCVLQPADCGGPLVGTDGTAMGINIARASRVASYAVPAEAVVPLLDDLKSGRLAPGASLVKTETKETKEGN